MRTSFAEHTRITLDGNAGCAGWCDKGAACVVGRYLDVGFRLQVRLGRRQQRGKAGDLRGTVGSLPLRQVPVGENVVVTGVVFEAGEGVVSMKPKGAACCCKRVRR